MDREMQRNYQTGDAQEPAMSDPLIQNDPWARRGPVSYGPAATRSPQAPQQTPYEGGQTPAAGAEGLSGNWWFQWRVVRKHVATHESCYAHPLRKPLWKCVQSTISCTPCQAPYRVLPGNPLGGAGLQELMMMNMMWLMKGHGKGSSPESSSWHVPSPDRRKRRKSRKQDEDVEERSEESEKDEAEEGERRPRGRRGPSGSDPSSDPTTPEASESSVQAFEVRSLLRRRARLGQERPSLGPRDA